MIELVPIWRWLFNLVFAGMIGLVGAQFIWDWKPGAAFGDAFMLIFLVIVGPFLWLRKDIYAAHNGDQLAMERITRQRFSMFRKVDKSNG